LSYIVIISVVIPFILFLVCVALSLMLAHRKNTQLFESSPESLPYTWGFFLGYSGIIGGSFVVATIVLMIAADFYRDWLLILLAYSVALGIASYGVLMRQRWGWLFHIPLSLNPGLWAFNSVYVHNRWQEFPWR
jgi:hypothetical protein